MDLWADFDGNNHYTPDAAEQERTGILRVPRRLSDRAILSLLRDWLLQDYAAAYCRALGATRIFRRCYWIDALGSDAKAGLEAPATLESTEPTRGGKGRKQKAQEALPLALSPLVSLAQALAQESKPITLYGLILAAGSSKRKETRTQENGATPTRMITLPGGHGIVHASWLEAAPTLLKEIEQTPAIFLLNPFGSTMFTHDDLAPLYQRAVPTELCLLIPHKQITARLQDAAVAPAQASALTALLRSDRWKTLLTGEEGQVVDQFIDLFVASLQRHFSLPVQTIAFPLPIGPAAVEAMPYTLLFATRRQDSLLCMNDAIYLHHARITEQSQRGVLAEEWFLAQQQARREQALRDLYRHICESGRAKRIRRWPDLRQQVLMDRFGQFSVDEYNAIIQQLLQNGEVRCSWRLPAAEVEAERIPGNDDTLVWR